VLCIPTVWPCYNVASEASRTPWKCMASGTTIRQAGSNLYHRMDIPPAISHARPLTFFSRKFTLEDLTSPTYCAKRVAFYDEQ